MLEMQGHSKEARRKGVACLTYPEKLRLIIIIPAYPAFNIYSHVANKTTALGQGQEY